MLGNIIIIKFEMEEGLSCLFRIFILLKSSEEIMWLRSELILCVKERGWFDGKGSKVKIIL